MAQRLLRMGAGSSDKAIARCTASQGLLRRQGIASVTFANRSWATPQAHRDRTRAVSLGPDNILARSFHANAICRSNCDFGGPCDCSECREISRRPLCDICKVNSTAYQSARPVHDRKGGTPSYHVTSLCEQCWGKYTEEEKQKKQSREQILASRNERLGKLMEYIEELPPAEQVPIGYALQRFLSEIGDLGNVHHSRRWYQRHLLGELSQQLRIVKVGKRYMCDKQRVDAMDFKLWFPRWRLDVDV